MADTCTIESHEKLKAITAEWESLPEAGYQPYPPDESGPGGVLQYRQCRCGSTLAKQFR